MKTVMIAVLGLVAFAGSVRAAAVGSSVVAAEEHHVWSMSYGACEVGFRWSWRDVARSVEHATRCPSNAEPRVRIVESIKDPGNERISVGVIIEISGSGAPVETVILWAGGTAQSMSGPGK